MTGMDDLVTWLRAQLDEDERVARAGQADGISQWLNSGGDVMNADGWQIADATAEGGQAEVAAHIAHWDPARVLAEVDAKRRLIELYLATAEDDELDSDAWTVMKIAIKLLALPMADRDGYREEWRP